MNITENAVAARNAIRTPTADRVHADLVACHASRDTRLLGGNIAECADAYQRAYAEAMRGER